MNHNPLSFLLLSAVAWAKIQHAYQTWWARTGHSNLSKQLSLLVPCVASSQMHILYDLVEFPAASTNKAKALDHCSPCPLCPQCLLHWNIILRLYLHPCPAPASCRRKVAENISIPKVINWKPSPCRQETAWAPSSCSQMYYITGTCSTDNLDELDTSLWNQEGLFQLGLVFVCSLKARGALSLV